MKPMGSRDSPHPSEPAFLPKTDWFVQEKFASQERFFIIIYYSPILDD